jgi:hypothetical protein
MADACRAHQVRPRLESKVSISVEKGWQAVTHHKQGRHTNRPTPPSPAPPHRSVLADLVGECFNCLAQTMWRRCGRTCHTASAVTVRGIRLGLLRLVAPLSALSTPGRGHQPLGSVV